MRKAPQTLAFFNILITVGRVAAFVAIGIGAKWTGWPFAVALAVSVYVSGYFARHKETKAAGIVGLIFFGAADLWFNEFELIRVLSTHPILPEGASFLRYTHEQLNHGMEISAIMFGAIPTISAAILGWMQNGADKVAVLKGRKVNVPFAIKIQAILANWLPEVSDQRQTAGGNTVDGELLPAISGKKAAKIPKGRLSADDKAQIAGMSEAQIVAIFGGSPRRARLWQKQLRDGTFDNSEE